MHYKACIYFDQCKENYFSYNTKLKLSYSSCPGGWDFNVKFRYTGKYIKLKWMEHACFTHMLYNTREVIREGLGFLRPTG